MLRITRKANGQVVFRVSGQLNALNVGEMGTLIEAEKKGSRMVLDLSDLRAVDGEAVKFLEKWETDSIKLKNCGLYIREWIRRERLERKAIKCSETCVKNTSHVEGRHSGNLRRKRGRERRSKQ